MASEADRRFTGIARLYGLDGAQRIAQAHVAVIGIGGVGSWAAEALARSGVGRLTLVDLDHVAESNLNRQVHALESTVGQAKVVAMQERIAQFNPACKVHGVEEFVSPANWPEVLNTKLLGPVDAVIDACDHVQAKLAMALWALRSDAAFVCAGAAGGKRAAHRVDIQDLSEVTHDPLLASLRYRLRKHNASQKTHSKAKRKLGITCVFSNEQVQAADPSCLVPGEALDANLNCHGYGSVVTVTSVFGQCAAGWVLNQLAAAKTSCS